MMTESQPPAVLEINDLRVRFKTEAGLVDAVDGISLRIGRGRILGLVGESGCGKSVTSMSVLRLIRPPGKIIDGTIKLRGIGEQESVEVLGLKENAKALYDVRGGVASMIFQEPMTALSPVHTVGNQVCEAILTHQDVSKAEAEALAVEMLTKVGIPNPAARLKQYPFEFSGGKLPPVRNPSHEYPREQLRIHPAAFRQKFMQIFPDSQSGADPEKNRRCAGGS